MWGSYLPQPASSPYTGWTHVRSRPLLNQIVNAGEAMVLLSPWMTRCRESVWPLLVGQVYGKLVLLHQDLQACKLAGSGLQSGWQWRTLRGQRRWKWLSGTGPWVPQPNLERISWDYPHLFSAPTRESQFPFPTPLSRSPQIAPTGPVTKVVEPSTQKLHCHSLLGVTTVCGLFSQGWKTSVAAPALQGLTLSSA